MNRVLRALLLVFTMLASAAVHAQAKAQATHPGLTPQNTVIVMVDYMDKLLAGVKSHPQEVMLNNATALAKIGPIFKLPVAILGDEGERLGKFVPAIHAPIPDGVKIARHTVSAWREPKFVEFVRKTGRKNLVMAGISTDMCVSLLAIDAIKAGYNVYVVVDASGSQSAEMHQAGLDRMVQAGATPVTWVSLAAELLGDWRSPAGQQLAELYGQHLGMR
jgi:nicotinamidase-related amidase